MRELLLEIAQAYHIEIEELEVSVDHVHIFCSFAPKFSITQVVTRFKSLSARAIFQEHPQIKRQRGVADFGKMATLPARWETKLRLKSSKDTFTTIAMIKPKTCNLNSLNPNTPILIMPRRLRSGSFT